MSFILRAAISFLKENMLVHGLGFPSDVRQDGDNVEFIQEGTVSKTFCLFCIYDLFNEIFPRLSGCTNVRFFEH